VKVKLENKDNGSLLVIRNLESGQEDSLRFVKAMELAEEAPRILLETTGDDKELAAGIYFYDGPQGQFQPLLTGKGHYGKMSLSRTGDRAAFLALRDTTEQRVTAYQLWQSNAGQPAKMIADSSAAFLPEGYLISEHFELMYSEDESKLFFGIAPPPILRDTSLLEEEIVNVEVWTYKDPRLYTHEEARLEEERKKAYTCVYHQSNGKIVQLGDKALPEIRLGNEGNAAVALGLDEAPYLQQISWEGYASRKDVYLVDVLTGRKERVAENVRGNPGLSPMGKYVYWYSQPDSAWFAYDIKERKLRKLAPSVKTPFYDELNDRPMQPYPYGIAGWTTEDDFIMVYDRYDVWLIDPRNSLAPNNLTKGRKDRRTYRYIKLDEEQRSIEEVKPMLFHRFDERLKTSGYIWFNIHTGIKEEVQQGPYHYTMDVIKAEKDDTYLFTRENFVEYPNLLLSQNGLSKPTQISNANPQQDSYRWGTAEPYTWTNANGERMEGILIKPEGFDPEQQYPMMTYFYERYADRLYRHWAPRYPRSFINFPYYASRGYVIFIPDIHYQIGYPGKSAFDAVTTGVSSLLEKGFIDRERLGVQGHSWGGYQSAYLITQTDLFKCAESGAPVVNMTSAYGGIRWASGLSRMFQYEHTQSRIGGTLWEKPMRYIENSPLFYTDKINTPVLILHNDEDGAVPWYQGIEFFVALRRLNKPAWLLNYNGDPHGVKGPTNRRDFMQRMQQFFDYYLLDAPMPEWMERGIPPIEKGGGKP
jgi:dipeptidyl aminopeptidase/acylaminoacyl peptidase